MLPMLHEKKGGWGRPWDFRINRPPRFSRNLVTILPPLLYYLGNIGNKGNKTQDPRIYELSG